VDDGIDQIKIVIRGLSLHHSQANWELFKNQAPIWARRRANEPNRIKPVCVIELLYTTIEGSSRLKQDRLKKYGGKISRFKDLFIL